MNVARPEVEPVWRLRPGAVEIGPVVRIRPQDTRPVRLIGRRWRERRMRGNRREENEYGPPRQRRDFLRIGARERKLIVDVPPPERWSVVVEPCAIVDGLEPEERTLRPASQQPWHDRDRTVPVTPECLDERIAVLGHQPDARALVPDLGSREQADVRKP